MFELNLNGLVIDERYQVRGRIGAGSYAEVFVARDLQDDGREVVLKALNAHLQGTADLGLEDKLVENFEKEASILKSISHPNIIAMLDSGESVADDGRDFAFIVLEYMQGGDLLRYTREHMNSCLSLGHALNYFRQICDGLTHAHENGIIHRDLKPNNFLLSPDYQTVKIADFGVAKLTSDETGEITRVGTGIFSAPEHSPTSAESTFGKLTTTADIYSLAKSFFALACGRSPTEFAALPITNLPPAVKPHAWSNDLLKILNRATVVNVGDRYGSVSEFWDDLASLATLDADALKPITKQRQSPEEQELEKKRAELAPLEAILAQRELDLATLRAELREFEQRYLRIVGVLYAELDEINARIAEAEAEAAPEDKEAQEKAAEARAQADETAYSTESVKEYEPRPRFKPSDDLKKLYRELARLLHPDLVLDDEEKARRHGLMAKANKAYEDGDDILLTNMLEEQQNSPDAIRGDGVGADLIRIIRRIARAEERLRNIDEEFGSLRESELFKLKSKVEEAEREERDLLAEMAAQIRKEITEANTRLDYEEQTKLKNG